MSQNLCLPDHWSVLVPGQLVIVTRIARSEIRMPPSGIRQTESDWHRLSKCPTLDLAAPCLYPWFSPTCVGLKQLHFPVLLGDMEWRYATGTGSAPSEALQISREQNRSTSSLSQSVTHGKNFHTLSYWLQGASWEPLCGLVARQMLRHVLSRTDGDTQPVASASCWRSPGSSLIQAANKCDSSHSRRVLNWQSVSKLDAKQFCNISSRHTKMEQMWIQQNNSVLRTRYWRFHVCVLKQPCLKQCVVHKLQRWSQTTPHHWATWSR